MKMKCEWCETEQDVNLWSLKNNLICKQCIRNLLGRAKAAVGTFNVILMAIALALATFLNGKIESMGFSNMISLITTICAIVLFFFIFHPLGTLIIYKIYNKSK